MSLVKVSEPWARRAGRCGAGRGVGWGEAACIRWTLEMKMALTTSGRDILLFEQTLDSTSARGC